MLDSFTVRSENVADPPEEETSTVPPRVAVLKGGRLRSICTGASAALPKASVTLTTTAGEIAVFTVVEVGCPVKVSLLAGPAARVMEFDMSADNPEPSKLRV